MTTIYHPQRDDDGRLVVLSEPSVPTPADSWRDPQAIASVVPDGSMPAETNGIAFVSWSAPTDPRAWESEAASSELLEPAFRLPPGRRAAAGTAIEEADGRIWLVTPSNFFAGYRATFPKGTVESGASLRATAIKETFEESGLRVRLTGFLWDSDRTRSYTRYYRAIRIGGNPANMGWESQAVHLVPRDRLRSTLTHWNDQPLLQALLRTPG